MLPVRFLKKHFSSSPDWLIGGLLVVAIFWLIVLPSEIYNISVGQNYYLPENGLGLIAKSLYLKGYLIATSWTPSVEHFFAADQIAVFVIMLLGMLIASPGYFLTGALLATRKTVAFISGILLIATNIIVSAFLLIGLAILLSG